MSEGAGVAELHDLLQTRSGALAELLASDGWAELMQAMRTRVGHLRTFASKRAHTKSIEEVRFLQGQIAAFEELMTLPEREFKRLVR